MNTTEVVKIVVAASIPFVTAVLGVLGIVFHDWRARRTRAGRRKLALESASRQVSFAAEWWNARRLLADSPEAMQEAASRTRAWLEEASALVMESRPPPAEERPPITVRRLLLLSDPFHRRAAKIIRGLFYVSLGVLVLQAGAVISVALTASERQFIPGNLVVLTLAALVALGFRWYAGFINKQSPERRTRRRATIRRSLLFYRLHGWAANVVRIIFYVWIALALTSFGFPVIALALTVLGFPNLVGEDPGVLPLEIAGLIVSIGIVAVFRHWAASLGTKSEAKKASATRWSQTTRHEPQS